MSKQEQEVEACSVSMVGCAPLLQGKIPEGARNFSSDRRSAGQVGEELHHVRWDLGNTVA